MPCSDVSRDEAFFWQKFCLFYCLLSTVYCLLSIVYCLLQLLVFLHPHNVNAIATVYSIDGRELFQLEIENQSKAYLSTAILAKGIYTILVHNAGEKYLCKMVK